MNIIEEQTMNDDTNPRISGNMDAGPSAPSAKKVYSKPTLVVLSQSHATTGKLAVGREGSPPFVGSSTAPS
jgi:hypothetical protein